MLVIALFFHLWSTVESFSIQNYKEITYRVFGFMIVIKWHTKCPILDLKNCKKYFYFYKSRIQRLYKKFLVKKFFLYKKKLTKYLLEDEDVFPDVSLKQ